VDRIFDRSLIVDNKQEHNDTEDDEHIHDQDFYSNHLVFHMALNENNLFKENYKHYYHQILSKEDIHNHY